MSIAPPGRAEWTVTSVPVGARELVLKQVSFEEVLAADCEGDREPWWAHVWPAGRALAAHVLAGPDLGGKRCLDLGTGAGVVGIALALKGATATLADVSTRALALAGENALRCGVYDAELLQLDWRYPPPRVFDEIYAADVVYAAEKVPPLVQALDRLLAPGGSVVLADPRRPLFPMFLKAMREAGFAVTKLRDEEEVAIIRARRER